MAWFLRISRKRGEPFYWATASLGLLLVLLLLACGGGELVASPATGDPLGMPSTTLAMPTVTEVPAPSSKGDLLAFSSGESIYVMSLADNSTKRVTDGYSPSLSPSGREVAYCKDRNIWVVDIEGKMPSLLAEVFYRDPVESCSLGAASVVWSPDGRFIVYNRSRTGGSGISEVWVMDREGKKSTRLLQSSAFLLPSWVGANQIAVYQGPGREGGIITLLSVDGQEQMVIPTQLQRAALSAQKSPREDVWLLGPIIPVLEGGDILVGSEGTWDVIAQGLNPIWSPDGERIAFIHDEAIWIMREDGSDKYQLVNLDLLEGRPKGRMPLVSSFLSWVAP